MAGNLGSSKLGPILGKDKEFKYARQQASILTPDFLDENNNDYDDRGEQLYEMVENSGDVYEWGWSGYWWGWSGYWWGWSGYWQSATDFSQDGFWQNVNWQTVEISSSSQSTTEGLEGSNSQSLNSNQNSLSSELISQSLADNLVENLLVMPIY